MRKIENNLQTWTFDYFLVTFFVPLWADSRVWEWLTRSGELESSVRVISVWAWVVCTGNMQSFQRKIPHDPVLWTCSLLFWWIFWLVFIKLRECCWGNDKIYQRISRETSTTVLITMDACEKMVLRWSNHQAFNLKTWLTLCNSCIKYKANAEYLR